MNLGLLLVFQLPDERTLALYSQLCGQVAARSGITQQTMMQGFPTS